MNSWLTKIDEWTNRHRPTALLLTVTLTIGLAAFVDWATGFNLFQQLFYPDRETVADVRFWSALVYGIAFATGLPVAFLLWHWRDRNVRDQIENARKDVNLKEFVEVQKMASGLFDEKMDKQAKTDLQIAALHQLSDFLGEEHPKSFRRAAFELLWPSDGTCEERVKPFGEWKAGQNGQEQKSVHAYQEYVDGLFSSLDRVALARISILHDEWERYFRSGFPLKGRDFSFLNLPTSADLSRLDFSGCHFIRASLQRTNFDQSIMRFTVLDRAFAHGACFADTKFFGGSLIYCGLSSNIRDDFEPRSMPVNFRGAELDMVNFSHAVVNGAQFQRAKFHTNQIQGADFVGCEFDDNTEFDRNWSHKTPEEKDILRTFWLERGAIRVD